MSTESMPDSAIIDRLDLQIIQCLQLSPRVSFRQVAEVIDVSEQTVARRYRRLRGNGVLRVVGLVNPARFGETAWQVRLRCRPDATDAIGTALARRDDVSWVTVTSGGSELVASVRARNRIQRDELLLKQLPSTAQVLDVAAFATLHTFRGSSSDDWRIDATLLSTPQRDAIVSTRRPVTTEPLPLHSSDEPMLEALARDGRATLTQLAAATGWTESKTARRLEALESSGTIFLDIDLVTDLLGYRFSAYLWLTVPPAKLDAAGRELAAHPQVTYAAAVTGPASLVASVLCRDADDLYRYLTTDIGAIEGIGNVEISPTVRRIKQAGSMIDGSRLALPSPR